ncbi:MAG: hypothetical protein AAF919_19315 [Pseudomonadota bacterium]
MSDLMEPETRQTVTAVKLYGERNTGTNYLARLIKRNFGVNQLRGVADHNPAARLLTRIAHRPARGLSVWIQNTSADHYFTRHLDETLGWKHCRVPVDRVVAAAPEGLSFVCLVKNPYSWLASLHRNPYSNTRPAEDFSTFIETPYPVVGRELMGPDPVPPIAIWNAKVRSYLDLQAAHPRVAVLRYEDFLTDETGCLSELARICELPVPDEWMGYKRATKQGSKSQSEIRDYYLGKEWLSRYDAAQLDLVNANLDADLARHFGYDLEGALAAT